MILMPPVTYALAGQAAPAAWSASIVAGAFFSVAIGLLAYAGSKPGNIAEVTGRVFGTWAERTIYGCYLIGFTVGQAAIAVTAGRLASAGFAGRPQPITAGLIAIALIVVVTIAVAAGVTLNDRARAGRLAATLALAVIGCSWPSLFKAAALLRAPAGFTPGSAVFLLFFAGVGWESMSRIGPRATDRRAIVRTVVTGAVLVAVVYLSLAVLLATREASSAPPALVRVLALLTAAVLMLYLVGGIAAAAGFLNTLTGRAGLAASVPVAIGAAVVAFLGAATNASIAVLLITPCCAALIGYLLATAAAIKSGAVRRSIGAVAISLLLAVPLAALVR